MILGSKRLQIIVIIVLILPFQIIETEGLDEVEDVIIYALPYDFDEFSVYSSNSYATEQWISGVYSALIKRSTVNAWWTEDLAKAMPSISENGLTFTFELKDDLYFSNSLPITTEDIEFSLKVAITPNINFGSYGMFSRFLDNDSLNVLSSHSFSISLKEVIPFPYSLLAFPIIPKATFIDRYNNCLDNVDVDCIWDEPDGSDAISAGPYKVQSIDDINEIVTLEANPYFYNADDVRTDKIVFQKVQEKHQAINGLYDGSIHILDSQYVPSLTELTSDPNIKELFVSAPAHQEVSLNHKHPYYGTGELIPKSIGETDEMVMYENARQLRRAMSHILDRNKYVNESMDGLAQAAATNMPPSALGFDPTILPDLYSIETAKEIMIDLGFDYSLLGEPDNETGKYSKSFFNITALSANTGAPRNEWSSDYVQQLPKIGIGVTQHVSTGWAEIIPILFGSDIDPPIWDEGGYDIFFVGYSWGIDWNPADIFEASGSCSTGNCANFYNFDLEEKITPLADEIHNYLTELDYDLWTESVKTIQALIAHWLPILPILYPQNHWAWSSDISGIHGVLISIAQQDWGVVSRTGFEINSKPKINETESLIIPFPIFFFIVAFPLIIKLNKMK